MLSFWQRRSGNDAVVAWHFNLFWSPFTFYKIVSGLKYNVDFHQNAFYRYFMKRVCTRREKNNSIIICDCFLLEKAESSDEIVIISSN